MDDRDHQLVLTRKPGQVVIVRCGDHEMAITTTERTELRFTAPKAFTIVREEAKRD